MASPGARPSVVSVLLSGGSGLLGVHLRALAPWIIAPPRAEMDVTIRDAVTRALDTYRPRIVVHAAALIATERCRARLEECLEVNVTGTVNVARTCAAYGVRLVYISTDYVFDGARGNYSEEDLPRPLNEYGRSKAAGELVAACVKEHLIIRTSFCDRTAWRYPTAFTDQYTSKDTVDVIAPEVLAAALSPLSGTLHIGTDRKSQYEIARRIDPRVRPIRLSEVPEPLPRDTSLNSARWTAYQATLRAQSDS